MQAAGDPAGHEALVIGSAVYSMHWMKEASEFHRRNRALLAGRPVWLFSSGPLGTEGAPGGVAPAAFATLGRPEEPRRFTR